MRLDDAQQQAADDGARHRSEPADHHGDEALERRPHAEHRRDLLVDREHQEAGGAADRGGARERQQHGARHIDPDQVSGRRTVDDGAQRQAEAAAVEHELHRRRQRERAHQHDQMIGAHQERPERERRAAGERRERIGMARQDQDGGLLELHPDREARHHGGDPGAGRHRRKAKSLDIDAGDYCAEHHGAGDRDRRRAVV